VLREECNASIEQGVGIIGRGRDDRPDLSQRFDRRVEVVSLEPLAIALTYEDLKGNRIDSISTLKASESTDDKELGVTSHASLLW
jgi:hypothetical protein